MKSEFDGLYSFGCFRLDVARKVLWHESEIVQLPPKAVELLCALVHKNGEVVGKNELLEAVWEESFVEESNLSHNIYLLRKTFKAYGEPDCIQTVPRRGYRFTGAIFKNEEPKTEIAVAEIEEADRAAESNAQVSDNDNKAKTEIKELPVKKSARRITLGVMTAAVTILIASGYAVWNLRTGRTTETVDSIAILPFKPFDENPENQSLGLRITDSLITRLGSLNRISVRPTISVAKFTDARHDPLEIGRNLAVDAVVEGRIQREGDKIRVTLQILSVGRAEQLWSRQFDGDADQILALQDDISLRIIESLDPEQATAARQTLAAEQPTANAEAYENYLKGRYHWNQRTAEGFAAAIGFFEQAIALDPRFAEAYSGLSDAHLGLYDYGYRRAEETIPKAKNAVSRAVQLESDSSEAYSTLSAIRFLYDRDAAGAEAAIKRAVELNSQNAAAQMRYGWYLTIVGRFDEALPRLENALRLDPTSPIIQTNIGYLHACAGRLTEAERQFNRVLEANPNFSLPHWYLAGIYFRQERKDLMYQNYLKAFELDYGDEVTAQIAEILKTQGERAALTAWQEKLRESYAQKYFPPSNVALVFALARDADAALDWLEEAERQKDPWLLQIVHDPEYEFLRREPRFLALIQKLNL